MTSRPWRFLRTPGGPGDWNMAVDEALAWSFEAHDGPPVFRVYSWDPPTLSLGRFQDPVQDLDWAALRARGIPVVRRMTGGGAIYHTREVTYSLVCRQEDLGTASVKDSFRQLCQVLIKAYAQWGLRPRFALEAFPASPHLGRKTPVCFAGKELYDIVVGERKLGGNAQRRLGRVIFQHGSIPLELDWEGLRAIFPSGALPAVEDVTSFRDEGVSLKPEELAQALRESLEQVLGVETLDSDLSPEERARAEERLDQVRVPAP